MNYKLKIFFLLLFCTSAVLPELRAQVIYAYTNTTGGTPSFVSANATGTSLTRVNGAVAPGSPCGSGFSSTSFSPTTAFSTTLQAVTVTVRPGAGYKLRVTDFALGIRRSNTGPANVRLAYSLDNGATWVTKGSNDAPNNAGCGSMFNATWNPPDFDVTSVTNGVIFRIFAFTASGSGGTFQIMNLNINGSVVPDGPPPGIVSALGSITSFCADGVHNMPIEVSYTKTGTFNTGNVFSLQISDAGGSFATPVLLGNLTTTNNGLIAGSIPPTVTPGWRKVRIVSSSPLSTSDTLNVNITDAVSLTAAITHPLCFDAAGDITTSITGGTAPFSHRWSNAATTTNLIAVPSGTYVDTVTDAVGCRDTQSFTINPPPTKLLFTVPYINPVLCKGESTGAAEVMAHAATPPYSYLWTDKAGNPLSPSTQIVNAVADTYIVKVVDGNMCEFDTNIIITEPVAELAVTFDSIKNASCSFCDNGYISARITGGTQPYSYLWNNGDWALSLDAVREGRYCLMVVDKNGCVAELCDTIFSATSVATVSGTAINYKLYPNPSTLGYLYLDISTQTFDDAQFGVYDIQGRSVFQSSVGMGRLTIDCSTWGSGIYAYRLVSGNSVNTGSISIQ